MTQHTVKLVKTNYVPKTSEIMQHYQFNMRLCQQGESVATFVAEFCRLMGLQLRNMLDVICAQG